MRYEKKLKKRKVLKKRIFFVISAAILTCTAFLGGNILFTRNSKIKATSSAAYKINTNDDIKSDVKNVNKLDIKDTDKPSENIGQTSSDIDFRESSTQSGTDMDEHLDKLATKGQKTAYLTFDDGPSANITPKVLDILDKYNVKATFFVIGSQVSGNKDLLIRENREGNAIGDHTFSHNYNYIYQNPKNLVDDFDKCRDTINSVLGQDYKIKYVRFPGGAFGANRKAFREAAVNAGYSFIDWNSLNGDAEANNVPPDKLLARLKETSKGKNTIVVLMHDASTKQTTVQALPQIIEYLKASGYIFRTLS